ncbi:MAG: hypothetical protein PF484_01150, partial [Bacteroidales bacterium]|nr:hypothetical protein [Bacteroidales bacterium]
MKERFNHDILFCLKRSPFRGISLLLFVFFFSLIAVPSLYSQNLIINQKGPSTANPGDIITYTITYQNISSVAATNVEIKDFLPTDNGSYVSSNPAGSVAGNIITWTSAQISELASLGRGGNTIEVQFRVGSMPTVLDSPGFYIDPSLVTLENNAQITCTEISTPIVSETVSTIVSQYCGSNTPLGQTSKMASSSNNILLYIFQITNTGNIFDQFTITLNEKDDSERLLYKQILDFDKNIISEIPTSVDGGATAQTRWLAPGATAYFFIKLIVPNGTPPGWNHLTLDLSSKVCTDYQISAVFDTDIHNNLKAPVIKLIKLASSHSAKSGETIIYTLFLFNTGKETATNVTLTDILPEELTFISANPQPRVNGGNSMWDLPDIEFREGKTISITAVVNVSPCNPLEVINTASVNFTDNTESPITSTASTIIEPTPITISKSIISTDITCKDLDNGTVSISATGGTGTISYTLLRSDAPEGPYANSNVSNGNSTGSYFGLPPGFYKVSISDGCTSIDIPTIAEVIEPLEAASITAPANVTVNSDAGLCDATGVTLGSPVTTDNCGIASVT